ncbi:MAG: histidinol-phosphate transaminase, partial [Nitrosopumilaceae archaeon]|nr:histidinol-phosphate transaminase [Nitrosopumilaceae archaeon]
MKNNWFQRRVEEISKLRGYQKPDLHPGVLKLDSNENLAINKQFQYELIDNAKKRSDVREYPLGKVENLIQALSKYLKISPAMIGVGSGSDQILDLILANFATKKTKILTSDP